MRPTTRAVVLISALFALPLLSTMPAIAQVPDPIMAAQAVNPQSAHHYIGDGAETVNPADGSLAFDLQLSPATGRQLSMPFGFRYASPEHFYVANSGADLKWVNFENGSDPVEVNGWSYDVPKLTGKSVVVDDWVPWRGGFDGFYDYGQRTRCVAMNGYVFHGFDRVQRSFGIGAYFLAPNFVNSPERNCGQDYRVTTSNANGVIATTTWPGDSATSLPVNVVDQSGTTYSFQTPVRDTPEPVGPPPTWRKLADSITDRNGNQILLDSSGKGYRDTLGRMAVSWTGIGNNWDQISVAGLPGNVVLHWSTIPSSVTVHGDTWNAPGAPDGVGCGGVSSSYSLPEITQIDLPNGQNYHFAYAANGKVSQIWYPGGGYVRYAWGQYPAASIGSFTWYVLPTPSQAAAGITAQQVGCVFVYDRPAVTDRWVSYDGQTEVLHQTFQYSSPNWVPPSGNEPRHWTSKHTWVTTKDLVTGQTSVTEYTYEPAGSGTGTSGPYESCLFDCAVPVETSIVYRDNSGRVLKTVRKSWRDANTIIGEQTILENGRASTTVRCYDGNGQVTAVYEYGFRSEGSASTLPSCAGNTVGQLDTGAIGPLKRVTQTSYRPFFGGFPNTQYASGYDGSYEGTHVVNAPDSITVQDPNSTDAAQQTQFAYTSSTSGSGAATGLVPVTKERANIQSIGKWSSSANSWLTTSYSWYDTGQLASKTDPCGNSTCPDMVGSNHTTNYTYTDSFASGTGSPMAQTHAYVTGVTYAKGASESFTWGFNDGQLRSHTDQNGIMTTYQYADSLGRITQAKVEQSGAQTDYAYDDSPYNPSNNSPSVTTTKKINDSLNQIVTTAMDGMGHTVRTLTSDPDGTDIVDTTYTGSGQVRETSNPHRDSPLPTDGNTRYEYDALGRPERVTKPDGSFAKTKYSGPCATVTDEASHERTSCTDGLGRLVAVDEPTPGQTGTPGSATISLHFTNAIKTTFDPCDSPNYHCPTDVYNSGSISVTINGTTYSTSYYWSNLPGTWASDLASQINSGSMLSASASGDVDGETLILTAKTVGTGSNYSISYSCTYDTQYFTECGAIASGPSALSGAIDGPAPQPLFTRYAYDFKNNLTCAVQKGPDTAQFTTCAAAPAAWRPRSFVYDSLSQLTMATNPESGTITYSYDANGNLQKKTDARSQSISYCYDVLNRMIGKQYSNTINCGSANSWDVAYTYDIGNGFPIGRRTGMRDATGSTTWVYDNMGRILNERRSIVVNGSTVTKDINYSFNLDGSTRTITYPSGRQIEYEPSSSGKPRSVKDTDTP